MVDSDKSNMVFPALTGVRAIAAFMVFVHHFTPAKEVVGPFIYAILKELHIGVTVFFVLSGFLIYLKYSQKSSFRKDFIFEYYKNRAARIYPVYFFLVICAAFYSLMLPGIKVGLSQEIYHLFLQVSFLKGFSYPLSQIGIGQAWTLTVEETFYFLFPLLVILLRRTGFFRSLLFVYLVGILLLGVGEAVQFQNFFQGVHFMAFFTFFGRAGEFFLGMWIARHYLLRRDTDPLAKRFPIRTTIGITGIFLCLFLFSQSANLSQLGFIPRLSALLGMTNMVIALGTIINNYLLPPFIGFFLYGLLVERSWTRILLETRLLVLLGKSSYVFYLIHIGFVQLLLEGYVTHNRLIQFILINLISVSLFYFVEEPWRRLVRQVRMPKDWSLRQPQRLEA